MSQCTVRLYKGVHLSADVRLQCTVRLYRGVHLSTDVRLEEGKQGVAVRLGLGQVVPVARSLADPALGAVGKAAVEVDWR